MGIWEEGDMLPNPLQLNEHSKSSLLGKNNMGISVIPSKEEVIFLLFQSWPAATFHFKKSLKSYHHM